MNAKYAVPAYSRFRVCRLCLVNITPIWSGEAKKIYVETDGTPHAPRCHGSKENRERLQLEARLAELHAMRERGEAK